MRKAWSLCSSSSRRRKKKVLRYVRSREEPRVVAIMASVTRFW